MSEIPHFQISEVKIHRIPIWNTPNPNPITTNILKPVVNIPGCVRVHRNNLNSLIDSSKDLYGTYTECGNFDIPSYEPLDYTPNEFKYSSAEIPGKTEEFLPPTVEPPKYEPKPKEDKPLFVECPGPKDLRVGQYASEFKLERVSGHIRSKDGSECITLYEDVKFIEQYIPNPPQLVSTAVIATVAASTPLLLNLIKPLIKNLFKKLTKKRK